MKLRFMLPRAVFAALYASPDDGYGALAPRRAGLAPVAPAAPGRGTRRPSGRRITLRVRIIAALIGITFIPLLVTTIGGIELARTSLAQQGDQTLYSRALARANQIDSYITSARNSVLAARTEIAPQYQSYLNASDPAVQTASLLDMRTTLHTASYNARGQSTALVDTSGRVVVADLAAEIGNASGTSPAVRAALAGSTTISGVTFAPNAPPDQQATVELAAPVLASGSTGQVIGALVERLSLQQITSWVDEDTPATGGGLLVEPDIGLIVAQSGQPGAFFSGLQPLSSDVVQQLIASQQYVPGQGEQPASLATHEIPGVTLSMLQHNAPSFFTAGSLDGSQRTGIRYARVSLSSVPWVYLLAASEATFTAPADNLVQFALIVAAASLIVAIAISVFSSRRISRQLVGTFSQLQRIAEGFMQLSTDQLRIAEEQSNQLDATRAALHNLRQTSGDLSRMLDAGLTTAQAQRREQLMQQQSGSAAWQAQQTQRAYGAWWQQWREALFPRLQRQYDVCSTVRQDVQLIAYTSLQNRQRSASLVAQATQVDVYLARGAFVGARTTTGTRRVSNPFGPGNLRLALLILLVVLGLLPSLIFVAASNAPLRENLTSLGDQILLSRARSDASAMATLLNQQEQSVVSIALPRLYADALTSNAELQLTQQSLVSATPDAATATLELVNADTGAVVVASANVTGQPGVADLSVVADARKGMVSISPVFDDPASQRAWYYIAAPIASLDNTRIAGVALGIFSLAPIRSLQARLTAADSADSPAYRLMIESADGIIVADSRQPKGTFTATATLQPTALNALWQDGRYPKGETPPGVSLPELSQAAQQPTTSLAPRRLTGQAGPGQPSSRYWLVPLAGTPWVFVEAQSLPVTTAVADELTRLDLLLSLAVLLLASALALVLGRSVIGPLRWLNTHLRALSQHLVNLAQRYHAQLERQEQALPPIDATAQALGAETDEVVMLLFAPAPTPSWPPNAPFPGQGPPFYSPADASAWPPSISPASPWPSSWPAQRSNPNSFPGSRSPQSLPRRSNALQPMPGAPIEFDQAPGIEQLQQAQSLAGGWKRRQQRISSNVVVALNAMRDCLQVSTEGQQAARELADATAQIFTSTV